MGSMNVLANVELFQDLPSPLLGEIGELVVRRHLPSNMVVFLQGDQGGSLYVVEEGTLKVFVDDEQGNQVILNLLNPGDCFGELSLLDGGTRSASVVTMTDATLTVLAREHFLAFLEHHPEAHGAVIRALVRRIRVLTGSVCDLALLDVYGRVAGLLSRLANPEDQSIRPRLTHREIASMVGSSREMVSRVMKELSTGGYLEQAPDALYLRKTLPPGW